MHVTHYVCLTVKKTIPGLAVDIYVTNVIQCKFYIFFISTVVCATEITKFQIIT